MKRDIGTIMNELDVLSGCLHEQPDGVIGGPIHIITDDGNIRDFHIASCWRAANDESNVVVKVISREILQRLVLLTEPQRLVWWLRDRIRQLGIDDVALADAVQYGDVDQQTNGAYDARIKLGEKFVWIGLEQQEALVGVSTSSSRGGRL